GLQSDRTKIVAQQTADGKVALFLIAGNRTSEVSRAVGHSSELPFAELLGRREVDIDEIRVAAVEAEWSRARRDLRPVGDAVERGAVDDIRGQVPAIARVALREALIEQRRTPCHRLVDTEIGAQGIAEAK